MEYVLYRIFSGDRKAAEQLDALLAQEGIRRDQNLDYTVGLYDDDRLIATGSTFGNTLRCLAVDSAYQGQGLLNRVVSHLVSELAEKNVFHLFVYTKAKNAAFFCDLGFFEICRVDETLVFFENRRNGFSSYLDRLLKESGEPIEGDVGAIVMNANPFTKGHRYLVEQAAAQCALLHLFVVAEDASLIPFSVRYRLVKEGVADLPNVRLHQTESYLISAATFPSYFLRDSDEVIKTQAALDVTVFCEIAAKLGVTRRFAGEEPFSHVTGIYNEVMAERLSQRGIGLSIIPRLASKGEAISASAVRRFLAAGDFESAARLVPETTMEYFQSTEAAPVLFALQKAGDVTHY